MDDLVYAHSPLDDNQHQVRLLSLLPASNHNDALRCELRIVDARDKANDVKIEEYEALSYAWGDATLTHRIGIDGRQLSITANLDTALRHLRQAEQKRVLWIDGICIDQSNHEEKSEQVRMLPRTFSRAKQMLVWLGPGNEDTDYAMLRLEERRQWDDGFVFQERALSRQDQAFRLGFEQILARSWWSRLWTSVELLFFNSTPQVRCGRYWNDMDIITVHSSYRGGLERTWTTQYLNHLASMPDRKPPEWALYALLGYVSDCQVTDPRDYVFAIAGCLPILMSELRLPDYSLSVSVVYQRATIALLTTELTGHDQFSRRSCTRGSRYLTIPSWCINYSTPDWFRDQREAYFIETRDGKGRMLGYERFGRPSYMAALPLEHDLDKGLLMLGGLEVDRIHDVLLLPNADTTRFRALANRSHGPEILPLREHVERAATAFHDFIQLILPFRGRVLDRLQRRLGKEQACSAFKRGAFWETLAGGWALWTLAIGQGTRLGTSVAGSVDEWERQQAGDPLATQYTDHIELERHFADALTAATAGTKAGLAAECAGRLSVVDLRALAAIAFHFEGSVLFLTEGGYFGRCPDNVRKGDVLTLLSINMYPVILRPGDDGIWEHRAHAYERSIMTGEDAQGLAALEQKKFWLR